MITAASGTPTGASSLRWMISGVAIIWALVAVGLYFESSLTTWIWPWDDARMTYIFLSSIAAAVAAPLAWIAIVNEPAALAGITIDGIVIGSAMVAVIATVSVVDSDPRLILYLLALAVALLLTVLVFRTFHPWPHHDQTEQPREVRLVFFLLVAILIPVGILLVLQVGNIFPWDLPGRTSSMIGGVFIGASAYFIYGIFRGVWVHSGGQLAGFLAYDFVLGIPYWQTIFDRKAMSAGGSYQAFPGQSLPSASDQVNSTSLYVYTGVITVSGLIALWYLVVNSRTRARWRR